MMLTVSTSHSVPKDAEEPSEPMLAEEQKLPVPELPPVNAMPPEVCAFCSHANPPGSAFCNECGAALHLTLCDTCEAVNPRTALKCHKCGAQLRAASSFDTTAEQVSPADAYDPPPSPTELAAAPSAVDEPGPTDSSVRLTWRPRRLSPVLLVLPLLALALVAYFVYQQSEAPPLTPATPVESAAVPENSAKTAESEGQRDAPEQQSDDGASMVAETPARAPEPRSQAEEEVTPPTKAIELNETSQQSQSQAAMKEVPSPQAAPTAPSPQTAPTARSPQAAPTGASPKAAPTTPPPRTAERPRQKPRSVKRDSAAASSQSGSDARIAPWAAPASSQGAETNVRPPAACTDAIAALGLCSRSNPDQGK